MSTESTATSPKEPDTYAKQAGHFLGALQSINMYLDAGGVNMLQNIRRCVDQAIAYDQAQTALSEASFERRYGDLMWGHKKQPA